MKNSPINWYDLSTYYTGEQYRNIRSALGLKQISDNMNNNQYDVQGKKEDKLNKLLVMAIWFAHYPKEGRLKPKVKNEIKKILEAARIIHSTQEIKEFFGINTDQEKWLNELIARAEQIEEMSIDRFSTQVIDKMSKTIGYRILLFPEQPNLGPGRYYPEKESAWRLFWGLHLIFEDYLQEKVFKNTCGVNRKFWKFYNACTDPLKEHYEILDPQTIKDKAKKESQKND